MEVGVLGMNHKSAPLFLREALAKAMRTRFGGEVPFHSSISYVLLSTCNRTELYFFALDLAEAHTYIIQLLRKEIPLPFEHHLYSYFGFDCFFHLARVTAGIDSALIGETEIQGQVKHAYEETMQLRQLPHALHYLFQKSLKIGKNVRTAFSLQEASCLLEKSVLQSAHYFLGDLRKKRLLFVGVSAINLKILALFKEKKIGSIHFTNRSPSVLFDLAKKEAIGVHRWEMLSQWHAFDMVIFGTKSPNYLIEASEDSSSPTLLVDLCVPRNVDPKLHHSSKVTLLNIDDLTPSRQSEQLPVQLIAKAVHSHVSAFERKRMVVSEALLSPVC